LTIENADKRAKRAMPQSSAVDGIVVWRRIFFGMETLSSFRRPED